MAKIEEEEAQIMLQDIKRHIVTTLGNDYNPPRKDTYYNGLAYSVRDRLIARWLESQRKNYNQGAKRVYYLSMEFLPGRFMMNYIINLQLKDVVQKAIEGLEFSLEELEEQEWDAGLGNGGLGRLASCFMDSMATLNIPGYGYGIKYDYGMFFQKIVDGWQVEVSDNWIKHGNPWEIRRVGFTYDINFYGRSESYVDITGEVKYRWVDTTKVKAMACDLLIPGYKTENVTNMRLWAALSSDEFDLSHFNQGDFMGAMESKVLSENISKVLYPSDEKYEGRELRLKQQYFLVAATFQDIIRRFKKHNKDFKELPNKVAVQLNDTHPTIAIAELMRILLDEEHLSWDDAWEICTKTFAYTNHTILPEALEKWPVDMIGRLLPRHLEIIFEINRRFLDEIRLKYPNRDDLLSKLSIIEEGAQKKVRMAHLAIIGSHKVNGVAELHSSILKESLFKEFHEIYPDKFINITNGITQRRWLLQANPALADLISSQIGDKWIIDLNELKRLIPLAENELFKKAWQEVKKANKERFARYVKRKVGIEIDPNSMFDFQTKRIHEYKRQLLNALHAITLYVRLKNNPRYDMTPRTIMFAGKAAPAYKMAKLIIKLINSIADRINNDPEVNSKLKVLFLPNYCVSQAEKVIAAADLSEQISTAGFEASGTGNMKFALNGALTIGTLDGANIEILQEVGKENMFIFGLNAKEVVELKNSGYNPRSYVEKDNELRRVLNLIDSNHFCPNEPGLFRPIIQSLLDWGDHYMLMADYRSYIDTQDEVAKLYKNQDEWTKKSILNVANMGKFSSDRSILEYASKIWNIKILNV